MIVNLSTPPSEPVVWQASRGRFVVLVQTRTWYDAREQARLMLGGEPEVVTRPPQCPPPKELLF